MEAVEESSFLTTKPEGGSSSRQMQMMAEGQATCLVEESLGIGVHQQLVQIVCNPASILYLSNQVAQGFPGGLTGLPGLHVQ